jgi:hypothetical protein
MNYHYGIETNLCLPSVRVKNTANRKAVVRWRIGTSKNF